MAGDERTADDEQLAGNQPATGKRAFFDALAVEWRERGFPGDEPTKVLRLRQRLGDLRGAVVFEPGCGAGRLTRLLADWVGATGRVIAVESSESMCAEARAAWSDLPVGTRERVELRHADAMALTLPPGSVDLALLFCVFPHFADKAGALRRFADWLRPGGRLVISHLEGSERLNTFHEGAGEPVRRDRIPPREVLEAILRAANLRWVEWIDVDEEFYLEARRPAGPGVGPREAGR